MLHNPLVPLPRGKREEVRRATDPPRRVHQEVQAMDLLVQGLAVHLQTFSWISIGKKWQNMG
jgi:hypothetical protein